ncbi:uncharacterized protein LOC111580571 isoform X2 [Amphiprion ocellaris]|uniref:uncharacterized protein LOC111580571 isoform X2 n=1 Tax=Amphiprion ocellaris TaxID=80972 RepID=UPI0024113D12|nr:uncharacterized protein LOC111580571 isoform X2 [Amphiprion ocellaris]
MPNQLVLSSETSESPLCFQLWSSTNPIRGSIFDLRDRAGNRKAGKQSISPSSPHTIVEGTEDQALAGMHRLNRDCWVWSPRPPGCLHPQHSGSLVSAVLSQQEDVEEEGGEHPAVCCYTTSCDDIISQAADAHCSTCETPTHSGIPGSSGLTVCDPHGSPSQQPVTVIEADQGEVSLHFIDGHCWEVPRMQTQGCVCVYGHREPEDFDPSWPGSPFIYYGGVRSNMVVGVEVVEEVAVEDTLEVMGYICR